MASENTSLESPNYTSIEHINISVKRDDADLTDYTKWSIKIAYGSFGGVISLIGLVFNIMAIIVWSSTAIKQTTSSIYMLGLALFDAVYLACKFHDSLKILYTCTLGNNYTCVSEQGDSYISNVFSPIYTVQLPVEIVSRISGTLITVVLAFDRVLVVTSNISSASLHSKTKARIILATVITFSCTISIPYLIKRFEHWDWESENYFIGNALDGFRTSKHSRMLIFIRLFFLISLITHNIIIIILLKKHNSTVVPIANVSNSNATSNSTHLATRQVLAITMFATLITVFPMIIFLMNLESRCSVLYCSPSIFIGRYLNDFLIITNSVVNFLFYYFLGKSFRLQFKKQFRCVRLTIENEPQNPFEEHNVL